MTRQEAVALRKACVPHLFRRDLAARMGISYTYLQHMENGNALFPERWQKRYVEEVEKFKADPNKENMYKRRWRLEREARMAELTPAESSRIELGV